MGLSISTTAITQLPTDYIYITSSSSPYPTLISNKPIPYTLQEHLGNHPQESRYQSRSASVTSCRLTSVRAPPLLPALRSLSIKTLSRVPLESSSIGTIQIAFYRNKTGDYGKLPFFAPTPIPPPQLVSRDPMINNSFIETIQRAYCS